MTVAVNITLTIRDSHIIYRYSCKLANVDIVYTPYPNLKKTGDMVAGQVGFHKNKKVVKVNIEKNNEVI